MHPQFKDDREKLAFMRQVAGAGARNPAIVGIANRLARPHAADDYWSQCDEIHRFVRDGIRYVPDPDRKEDLQPAIVIVQRGYGDCDDKVCLAVALARSIGIEADHWPLWAGPMLKHVSTGYRWPGSEKRPEATRCYELDGPPGDGWIIGEATIRGVGLGENPWAAKKNPETGRLPLA